MPSIPMDALMPPLSPIILPTEQGTSAYVTHEVNEVNSAMTSSESVSREDIDMDKLTDSTPSMTPTSQAVRSPVTPDNAPTVAKKRPHETDEETANETPIKRRKLQSSFTFDAMHAIAAGSAGPEAPLGPKPHAFPTREITPTYCILAHDPDVQRLFDRNNIAFGIQWELARFHTANKLHWDDLNRESIKDFQGTCEHVGPRLVDLVSKWASPATTTAGPTRRSDELLRNYDTSKHAAYERERIIRTPWGELDNEQAALMRDRFSGLGCSDSRSDVYHGKVLFVTTLVWKDRKDTPEIRFEKPEIGASTRLARRFGSRRFIRMKDSYDPLKKPTEDQKMKFILQRFVFMGRVYRPFYEKEGTVHLVETDEAYEGRVPEPGQGDHQRISFSDFVNWHNPMELNKAQIMTKWASRFALGLSTSIPGVRISRENVNFIPDILSNSYGGVGKPESHEQLTDGCGFINGSALRLIAQQVGWDTTRSAVQARFGGAKGMFVLHPDLDFDGPPAIWIRDSQQKIRYSADAWDPAMLIVDVVKPPHLSSPAKLSAETIVVLSDRGVKPAVILGYLRESVKAEVEEIMNFKGNPLKLWNVISRAGGVIGGRLKRAAAGAARAKGLGIQREEENELLDDDVLDIVDQRSTAWWGDEISACPSSIEESAMYAIQSGFTPANSLYLRRKVRQVLIKILSAFVSRHKIRVANSAEGFVVPSPIPEALKPGEIYLRMSKPLKDQYTGMDIDVITGPVLLVRHPCKLPSDIQLAMAVDRPELRHWRDVIITSVDPTQPRSLLSKLSGGDYDGDIVAVYWDKKMIESFQVASDEFLDPPPCIGTFFEHATGQVSEFLQAAPELSVEQQEREIQECLLASIRAQPPGLWSVYHDLSVYMNGLDDPRTIILANMFTTCLDGAKSGLRVKAGIESAFKQTLNRYELPHWKMDADLKKKQLQRDNQKDNIPYQPGFIMEQLHREGKQIYDAQLALFENQCRGFPAGHDQDLKAPIERIERLCDTAIDGMKKQLRGEILAVYIHVKAVRDEHRAQMQQKNQHMDKKDDKHDFTSKNITVRQDILRALSRKFQAGPPAESVPILMGMNALDEFKASMAYQVDWSEEERRAESEGGTSFPFDVAMRGLCAIKAKASKGGYTTLTRDFSDAMVMYKKAIEMSNT